MNHTLYFTASTLMDEGVLIKAGVKIKHVNGAEDLWIDPNYEHPEQLTVIFDYRSFDRFDSWRLAIIELIICFPEVTFLFDETTQEGDAKEFKSYLLNIDEGKYLYSYSQRIITRLHAFTLQDIEKDKRREANNLFDGSNLRSVCLEIRNKHKSFYENYSVSSVFRQKHLALSADVSKEQNLLNSYLLYANGFRVMPILSKSDLKLANGLKSTNDEENSEENVPRIIFRDFDLQFPDQGHVNDVARMRDWLKENDTYSYPNKTFWDKLYRKPIYFVSGQIESSHLEKTYCCGEEKVHFYGQKFPISGIYQEFKRIVDEFIKSENFPDLLPQNSKHRGFILPHDDSKIISERKGRNHTEPPNLSRHATEMIDRARKYFSEGKYIFAAVVSRSAIEYLNGFHQDLTLATYKLLSISENAIAMSVLGGDEKLLAKDARFRAKLISDDVERLEPDSKLRKNILNQIFADCRKFCKETEHYDSEDVFISELAYLNSSLFQKHNKKH